MAFEQARDLRSNARDTKRVKDHNHKWARGNRPLAGVKLEWPHISPLGVDGEEEEQGKIRPHRSPHGKHIRSPNVTKTTAYGRGMSEVPYQYWWPKTTALAELHDSANMSRSLRDLLPSHYSLRKQSVSDDYLYSFDNTESPGQPLSLEVFIKTNTKETEKFVEKEYEILDYNGDAVKGRKALKDLHRGKTAPAAKEPELVEDEGFELL